MTKRLILLFLFVLFIYACGPPKNPSLEELYKDATKWYDDCSPYPRYHPGDFVPVRDQFITYWRDKGNRCIKECIKTSWCPKGRGEISCLQNRGCGEQCYKKFKYSDSIALHIEGGYYSDGSYYAGCKPFYFKNIHPTSIKYKKTKWQTDRDDCMKLTSENVIRGRWQTEWSYDQRSINYYKDCLKERGY